MGTLRSKVNHVGLIVNETTLGEPSQDYDEMCIPIPGSEFCWEDARLPNGNITIDGVIVPDETEII